MELNFNIDNIPSEDFVKAINEFYLLTLKEIENKRDTPNFIAFLNLQKNSPQSLINEFSRYIHIYPQLENQLNFAIKTFEALKYFIEMEIERETKGNPIVLVEEIEPLNTKQVQRIGLLIRSGIVTYLREKNPKISNNQIAGFIDLLTIEKMKQTSINPHLKKEDNPKYPIKNKEDKNDLDLILKRFGIKPQSE